MNSVARSLPVVLALVFAATCFAQAPASDEEAARAFDQICQKSLCREPMTVRVLKEDGSVLEVPIKVRLLYIQPNGWITIFPGEEVFIEMDVDGEQLKNPRAVRKPEKPSNTITFKFWQERERKDSFLSVTNPFQRLVKFNLGMMPLNGEHLLKTTSCPVLPDKALYEHWPHPIFQLVVANIRFLPEGAEPRCEN